jgi:phenylacetate-CoA ligase
VDISDMTKENTLFRIFESFKKEITTKLKSTIGIRPTVELLKPNTLERTEFKSKRVIDKRDFIKRVE